MKIIKPLEELVFSILKRKRRQGYLTVVQIVAEVNGPMPGFSFTQIETALINLCSMQYAGSRGCSRLKREYCFRAPRRGSNLHRHNCPCGNHWEHDDRSFGSDAEHTCSRCGRQVWAKAPLVRAA